MPDQKYGKYSRRHSSKLLFNCYNYNIPTPLKIPIKINQPHKNLKKQTQAHVT